MAWSCLGGGALFNVSSEKVTRLKKVLKDIQGELNATSIEAVVYAWVRKHPSSPLVIVGTSSSSRQSLAVDSIDIAMNTEQWYRILEASNGVAVP